MSPVDSLGRAGTILLLGGNSDIGRAIVRRMAGDGARSVILAGRDTDSPTTDIPVRADQIYFDAADLPSHAKFFDQTFIDHPDIDSVIFACGVLHDQAEVDANPGLAVEMAEVNYLGTSSALLRAANHLRARGAGQLIMLSSVAGVRPRRSNFVYGATKAGIDFLARGLGDRERERDLHVLVVRPGFVRTSMTEGMEKRPFAVSPEAVADAVVAGLARGSKVVYVPSILRWVMALVRILPSSWVKKLES